jgi:hypothetical protein
VADLTTDPKDPRLGRGTDKGPTKQHDAYLIAPQLPEEIRQKSWVRPLRQAYKHTKGDKPCGGLTTISREIGETYALKPHFYGATYCVWCRMHLPVGEFTWHPDGEVVGS